MIGRLKYTFTLPRSCPKKWDHLSTRLSARGHVLVVVYVVVSKYNLVYVRLFVKYAAKRKPGQRKEERNMDYKNKIVGLAPFWGGLLRRIIGACLKGNWLVILVLSALISFGVSWYTTEKRLEDDLFQGRAFANMVGYRYFAAFMGTTKKAKVKGEWDRVFRNIDQKHNYRTV